LNFKGVPLLEYPWHCTQIFRLSESLRVRPELFVILVLAVTEE
jgi:hypothetical protein